MCSFYFLKEQGAAKPSKTWKIASRWKPTWQKRSRRFLATELKKNAKKSSATYLRRKKLKRYSWKPTWSSIFVITRTAGLTDGMAWICVQRVRKKWTFFWSIMSLKDITWLDKKLSSVERKALSTHSKKKKKKRRPVGFSSGATSHSSRKIDLNVGGPIYGRDIFCRYGDNWPLSSSHTHRPLNNLKIIDRLKRWLQSFAANWFHVSRRSDKSTGFLRTR